MTTDEYNHVSSLLERFFDGSTTKAEEQTLCLLFSEREDIPEEWAPYRAVFAYFDKGITEECLPAPKVWLPQRRRRLKRIAVVAASVALLLAGGGLYLHRETPFDPYEGSYIIRNGVRITDLDLIRPELEATLQRVMEEQAEVERLIASANDPDPELKRIIEELNLVFQTE
jgi:hypothetical protein